MKKEANLPEGVTTEMVAKWKEQYGADSIKKASLKTEMGIHIRDVIVRVPDRKTVGEFEKYMNNQPLKSKEILVNACCLTDQEAVKADDEAFNAAYNAIANLIPVGKFELADL